MSKRLSEIDYIGKKYNALTILSFNKQVTKGKTMVFCQCNCGKINEYGLNGVKRGDTKSCGCSYHKNSSKITGFLYSHRIRGIWHAMKKRCYNKNQISYKYYGGRNIIICDQWLDEENGLLNFYNWAISNGYSDELSIDRINNDGNYEPSNCRWATLEEQANNKRNNKSLVVKDFQKNIKSSRTGGYSGVYLRKDTNQWRATITISLGTFNNFEDAVFARKNAELLYWNKS